MTSKNYVTDKKHFKNASIPQNVKKIRNIIKKCLKTKYNDVPKDVVKNASTDQNRSKYPLKYKKVPNCHYIWNSSRKTNQTSNKTNNLNKSSSKSEICTFNETSNYYTCS